jgi:hypothetical protein
LGRPLRICVRLCCVVEDRQQFVGNDAIRAPSTPIDELSRDRLRSAARAALRKKLSSSRFPGAIASPSRSRFHCRSANPSRGGDVHAHRSSA